MAAAPFSCNEGECPQYQSCRPREHHLYKRSLALIFILEEMARMGWEEHGIKNGM
jgi:hypothetical protein